MGDARADILGRIRKALSDVPADEHAGDVPVTRDYRREVPMTTDQRLARFEERLRDYHADVRQVPAGGVPQAVAQACEQMGLGRVVVPPKLPAPWRPARLEVVEDRGLTGRQLDDIDGAITGCAAAIAETGTLVLDGGALSGRRAITLVPDHHICIVTAEQVHASVPEAIAAVARAVQEGGAPITLVSGPSASSDIELNRVEGVHGPRQLLVLLTGMGEQL
jgi:L-lactate dehydrogenase complex protein LldG